MTTLKRGREILTCIDAWKIGREINDGMKERKINFNLQWRHEREEEKFLLTMTTWRRGREILTYNDNMKERKIILTYNDDMKERKRNFNLQWRPVPRHSPGSWGWASPWSRLTGGWCRSRPWSAPQKDRSQEILKNNTENKTIITESNIKVFIAV